MASQTITALGNAIINLVDRKTPIATANTVGMVKPDGSTIKIDANGVISSNGGGGSGLELCDIGMALYLDETKGLRRYLNGQIVDINTNTQAFLNRLQEITTLHPSLLCTEEEWQSAKTMSAFGQVGKFVFNYSGDEIVSVRIPRVVNVQGLFDLQNLGMTIAESLPNITGNTGIFNGLANAGRTGSGAIQVTQVANDTWGGYGNGAQTTIAINASKSSSTYQNGAPVQQEAIQYPYFIQIATGSETENNIINEIKLNNPYSLFDSKYSDHELNNLSWLKSEGQWNSKAVYPNAYDKLLKVYNGTETVEGLSVKLSTETYTDYDFVLNTAEETFRLPLLDGSEDLPSKTIITQTFGTDFNLPYNAFVSVSAYSSDAASDGILSVILPDDTVTHTIWRHDSGYNTYTSPLMPKGTKVITSGGTNYTWLGYYKAQGNGSLYYYVGETVQNANLIDAGRIGEQLANKQDKCIHISSTYVNGTSGYRIWSDGYCEQWGFLKGSDVIVTLLKKYKDTNYEIYCQWCGGKSTNFYSSDQYINNITSGGFQTNGISNNNVKQRSWRTCGYIA